MQAAGDKETCDTQSMGRQARIGNRPVGQRKTIWHIAVIDNRLHIIYSTSVGLDLFIFSP